MLDTVDRLDADHGDAEGWRFVGSSLLEVPDHDPLATQDRIVALALEMFLG